MPISLPPISRRGFLSSAIAAGVGLSVGHRIKAEEAQGTDPHCFALLADTHISADRDKEARGIKMYQSMRQVVDELSELKSRPAGALICGDCAFLTGEAEDYVVLTELLTTIGGVGIPVHLALGNHDHRERFWKAILSNREQEKPVVNRHLTLLESERANWFILDSLDETNVTPGVLGKAQLDWLAPALDAHAEKPALVMLHHNPDRSGNAKTNGLVETQQLLEVLTPRKQVKALFFGHTHDWRQSELNGIHFINLPPVAYPFNEGRPSGWIDMHLRSGGSTLELHSIDPTHAEHGKAIELAWRI